MKKLNRVMLFATLLLLVTLLGIGCGPARTDVFESVGPSESAFVIPLEGQNLDAQGQFQSVDYLEAQKVAVKRIQIPLREKNTGRMWWNYEWIPNVLVIKVDRAPITREWTSDLATGTMERNEALHIQSKDNIGFRAGATITASIMEEDAATYLYHFGGKTLASVLDENVRGYCQQRLADEFGKASLLDAQQHKAEAFEATFASTRDFYKLQGVTIQYFGSSGGFIYDDPKIQEGMDKRFLSENDKQVAANEQAAQQTRNQTLIQMAEAKEIEARHLAAAADGVKLQATQQAIVLYAQATKAFADGVASGKVTLPNFLPAGQSLMGIDLTGQSWPRTGTNTASGSPQGFGK